MVQQELEEERLKLMEDVTANKRKMKELEDNLLYKLSNTQGKKSATWGRVSTHLCIPETKRQVAMELDWNNHV